MSGRLRGSALGATVFVAGAATLSIEIAASRVLSPYFGNSLYVWGALIGVVLSGLALGYWAGGTLADRHPSPALLVGAVLLGAGLVLAIPLVDSRVLDRIVDWDPGPRADPLLAAIVLFGPPSLVLAGVTPIAVRLRAPAADEVGGTAGRLFALSTAGSIFGTFATAFYLVPELGTDELLGLCGVVLCLAALPVVAAWRLPREGAVALAAAAGAVAVAFGLHAGAGTGTVSAASLSNWSPVYRSRTELYRNPQAPSLTGFTVRVRKDTRYHHLLVVDDDTSRFLRFDNSFQSGMWLGDPLRTRFEYTDYFGLGALYAPRATSTLFVGLGGGSAVKRFRHDFPDMRLQVVELDPEVVKVARRWFALPPSVPVAVEDGRRWLERHDERFDVIAIDAYFADSVPFHMTTVEFLRLVHSRLKPGGVVVANVIGSMRGEGSQFLRSVVRTYRSVFPTVALHPVYTGTGFERDPTTIRNVALVATDSPAPDVGFLKRRWNALHARRPGVADLRKAIGDRYQFPIEVADVPTLTDDYAPTDSLISG